MLVASSELLFAVDMPEVSRMFPFLIVWCRRRSLVVLHGLAILKEVFVEDISSLCKHAVLDLVEGIDKPVLDCFLLEPETLVEVAKQLLDERFLGNCMPWPNGSQL